MIGLHEYPDLTLSHIFLGHTAYLVQTCSNYVFALIIFIHRSKWYTSNVLYPSIIYIVILLSSFINYFIHYNRVHYAPDIVVIAINAKIS